MHTGKKASFTLIEYGDKVAIPFTQITVAAPAQVTCPKAFTLQLKGPFNAFVWAGSQPLLLSVPSVLRLLVLVNVFQRSIAAIIG
jgi:hypothetical protein